MNKCKELSVVPTWMLPILNASCYKMPSYNPFSVSLPSTQTSGDFLQKWILPTTSEERDKLVQWEMLKCSKCTYN